MPLDELEELCRILAKYAPEAEVWAYGSRVDGDAHEGSDLDLVLRNPGDLDAPQPKLEDLKEALYESDLPILIDALDWARIPESFRREIARSHTIVR